MESSDNDGGSNWRQWRIARIERFTEIQRRIREWINFAEIAEWCSAENGVVPNEDARGAAYQKLQLDLLEGDFEENGRSRVLYLHPYTMKARMTRDWLRHLLEVYDEAAINAQYLTPCWIPREFFERWLAKHRMQASPLRFAPKSSRPPAIAGQPVTQSSKAVAPAAAHGASEAAPHRRFGPEPGKLRRYADADRALFPQLERIMAKKKVSRTAAALALAEDGRIAGIGNLQSRAKRLAALHKLERGGGIGRSKRRKTR